MLLFHEEKKLKARVRLTSHNILEIANPSRIHRCLNLGTLFRLNGNPLVPALDAATEGADLGCFIAPKGLYDSARGFNPGNLPKPHRALKGRKIDWFNNVYKKCNRHPFQRAYRRTNIASVLRSVIRRNRSRSLAPLQGASPGGRRPLGF